MIHTGLEEERSHDAQAARVRIPSILNLFRGLIVWNLIQIRRDGDGDRGKHSVTSSPLTSLKFDTNQITIEVEVESREA